MKNAKGESGEKRELGIQEQKAGTRMKPGFWFVTASLFARLVSGGKTLGEPGLFQLLKPPHKKSFGESEALQLPATTECFIAVWKCLFSEHKFKGQIQGMSRNKAYHHVN